jgi:hypothetical protein
LSKHLHLLKDGLNVLVDKLRNFVLDVALNGFVEAGDEVTDFILENKLVHLDQLILQFQLLVASECLPLCEHIGELALQRPALYFTFDVLNFLLDGLEVAIELALEVVRSVAV